MAKQGGYSFQSMTDFISDHFGLIFLAALLLVGGFFAGSIWTENQMLRAGEAQAPPTAQQIADDQVKEEEGSLPLEAMSEITADDHILGSENPQVYLIEYSDFECSYCQRFHPTIKQVLEEYGDQVAVIYRHYPLSFHPHAQVAAETSECVAQAAGEDAFWRFVDVIFEENQKLGGSLSDEAIQTATMASGADLATVQGCVENGDTTEVVNTQLQNGAEAGVSGTPGTIVLTADGEMDFINGALPYAQVKQVLDQYL